MATLTLNGKSYSFHCSPLDEYLASASSKPLFRVSSSPVDKGYDSFWEIQDQRLLLTGFSGVVMKLFPSFSECDVGFSDLFPGKNLPWFADWFTGTIKIQSGSELYWNHHFGSTLEYQFSLDFRNGVLIDCLMSDIL